MIKISVIVPVYNAETYLDMCIQSIINQTYRSLEIILVNNGSTDKSREICDKYRNSDDRIVVVDEWNKGIVTARATGISIATGDYITFVDADDYVDIDAYEILVNKIEGAPDMILYNLVEEYSDRSLVKENHFDDKVYDETMIRACIIPQMLSYGSFFDFGVLPNLVCKLIKCEFLKKTEYEVDKTITVGEDAALTYQLLANASRIQLINYAPYHYCKREDSMMWKPIAPGSLDMLKNNLLKAFEKADIREVMAKQLDDYITFVSLLKCPERVFGIANYMQKSKVALYGAGGFGQAISGAFSDNVVLWVDGNYEYYKRMNSQVNPVDALLQNQDDYDKVFIAILNTNICREVKNHLLSLGIKKPIVYWEA